MKKKSVFKELGDLRAAAQAVFSAGPTASKLQWEALRKALTLPEGTKPGE